MPAESAYTNPDLISALYNDPENEVLLAAYLMDTGGIQLGQLAPNLGVTGALTGVPIGGGGGGGENEPPCFVGETLYTLFNGEQIPMSELYENSREYIGKGARSFTQDKYRIIVPGEIRDVTKRTLYELLHVEFEGEAGVMRLAREHRFWMRNDRFKPMCQIQRPWQMWSYGDQWRLTRFTKRTLVKYPDGVDVYNSTVGIFHDYFATQPGGVPKAVSNVKEQQLP